MNSSPNRSSGRKEKQMNARTRRTYLTVWIALGLASAGLAEERPADPAKADYHVAPGGKDTNPGTAAAPFATVQAARDAVRKKIRAGLTKDVLVLVRGGTYRITEAIDFGPEDSGTEKHAITYAAAPGEKVVVSGGRPITGWKKGEGEIWTAEIPEVKAGKWYFRHLFVNGYRAIRARTPNAVPFSDALTGRGAPRYTTMISEAPGEQDRRELWWSIAKSNVEQKKRDRSLRGTEPWLVQEPAVVTLSGPVASCRNPGDAELLYMLGNASGRKRLQSIDPATKELTLRPPHLWNPACFSYDWWLTLPERGRPCRLENAREWLDSPGEWCLDRETGILSYWPRPGEDLSKAEAVAPVADTSLLVVAGSREKPVMNVHLRGLRFEHLDWPLPEQGCLELFCCNVPVYREGKDPGHRFIDAAVEFTHARSCSFRDGAIAHAGGMGLCLRERTADIAVEGNEIHDLGGGGIGAGQCNVGGGYTRAAPPPEPGEYQGYRIANNHVHHCGTDVLGSVGIAVFWMRGSVVSHNLVHDIAYFGMGIAGDQGANRAIPIQGNVVERNHVHRAMLTTDVGSDVYMTMNHGKGGLVFRDNFLHDAGWGRRPDFDAKALGLDLYFSGARLERNVLLGCPSSRSFGFHGKLGRVFSDNVWQDNVRWGDAPMPATELFPDEFLEVMRAYTGLEAPYRESLQGTKGQPCELHELETVPNDASWHAYQYDLPRSGRGVVLLIRHIDYQVLLENEDPAVWWKAGCESVALRPKGLDASATYRIGVYVGSVERRKKRHNWENVVNSTWPYVSKVAVVEPNQFGIKAAAPGRELGETGLTVKVGASPCMIWIAYRRAA